MKKKVGFISFRFAGIDGVSLETQKWVEIFTRQNWECYFCAGEVEAQHSHSYVHELLHFNHPKILDITSECFSSEKRSLTLTEELHSTCAAIKKHLYAFIKKYDINLLVLQNILAIPMNIPLSMAVVEVLAETRIHTIAHHHDFYWERDRYTVNCVQDILSGYFPANLSNIIHVTINSLAMKQLGFRTGVSSTVVPNVMEFERTPQENDAYTKLLRKELGISKNSKIILQPTRIVQRKGIEHAIELARKFSDKAVLMISHSGGDEGNEYQSRVLEFAKLLGVKVLLTADRVQENRGTTADGKKIFSLADAYYNADIVSYPSLIEGFGNAFLEAIYFRKPIIINQYPVYTSDIRPKGFKCIEFDSYISSRKITEAKRLLTHPRKVEEMVETNYNLALTHYSYARLYKLLEDILQRFFGM